MALEELSAKCQEEKGSLDDLEKVDGKEVEGQVDDLASELLDSCPKNDLVVFVDSLLLQGSEEKADGPFSSLLQEAKQLEPDICWKISNQKAQLNSQIQSSSMAFPSHGPFGRKLKLMRSKVGVFTRGKLFPENTPIKKGEKAAKPRQWLHKPKEKLLDEVVIELQKLVSGVLNNEKERQRFAGAIRAFSLPA
ncbi:hypothetical protein L210DRAFT_3499216 [Boletus edulis BED1]|uniref:Uncharacterized protein n=1 Tax=Boletus edulis BED1 TaxID=1328754 RepID=A0AAD4GMX7_BOLED|nr:hypothetical protein L210DRAFT_3499216 [Boletus edulis BED1]